MQKQINDLLLAFLLHISVVIGRILILNAPYHLLRTGEKVWTIRVFVVQ